MDNRMDVGLLENSVAELEKENADLKRQLAEAQEAPPNSVGLFALGELMTLPDQSLPNPESTAPPQPERPRQSGRLKLLFHIMLAIVAVGIVIIASWATMFADINSKKEADIVDAYVKTTCLIEGFAQYEAYRDHNQHWRGFCLTEFEAYEIPMHPDLNLIQQR